MNAVPEDEKEFKTHTIPKTKVEGGREFWTLIKGKDIGVCLIRFGAGIGSNFAHFREKSENRSHLDQVDQ